MSWMRYIALGFFVTAVATGCARQKVQQDDETGAKSSSPALSSGENAQTNGTQFGVGPDGRPLGSDGGSGMLSMPLQKVIHFEYDRSNIREMDRPALNAHADYLMANPQQQIRLEGHADERGSREYNMALGEERAQSVYQYLNILGVSAQQMSTLSYGEEQPIELGHDETSWQLNRRVEIVYLGL